MHSFHSTIQVGLIVQRASESAIGLPYLCLGLYSTWIIPSDSAGLLGVSGDAQTSIL